jgi:hypothetical protein
MRHAKTAHQAQYQDQEHPPALPFALLEVTQRMENPKIVFHSTPQLKIA